MKTKKVLPLISLLFVAIMLLSVGMIAKEYRERQQDIKGFEKLADIITERVKRDVLEVLDNKDVILTFPHLIKKGNTVLVLKSPKTKTSVRKVFLPTTVAQMLVARKQQIDELKELFGDEYTDYNLVFCNSSGRPMEGQVITHALKKLIRENNLPDVVFHSFRHASITYKLKWNGGDVKSVQGDSGHARAEMVSNVYSHIIDEDRRFNAQRFEERFYQGNTLEADTIPPMPKFESSTELPETVPIESDKKDETATETQADTELIAKLLSNPETAALLKALASKL